MASTEVGIKNRRQHRRQHKRQHRAPGPDRPGRLLEDPALRGLRDVRAAAPPGPAPGRREGGRRGPGRALRLRRLLPPRRALRPGGGARGLAAAAALQPGPGLLAVRGGAGRRRRRHRHQPLPAGRGAGADRGALRRAGRGRVQAGHHRRRPHHRAAAAAHDGARARSGGAAALRRAPGHLGHVLRRAVHPRHPVPPRLRGGHPRLLGGGARRHPRPAVQQAGPQRRPAHGLRHRDVRGRDAPGRGRGGAGAARADRRAGRCTSRSTSTSWTRRTPPAPAPRRPAA